MKMIGLKDATTTASDLNGRMSVLSFKEGEEIDVPDHLAGIAESIGYARPAQAAGEEPCDAA